MYSVSICFYCFYEVYLVELAFVDGQPKLVVVEGSFQAEELSEVAFPLGPCFVELPQPLDEGLQAVGASKTRAGEPPWAEDQQQSLTFQQVFQAVHL